MTWVVTIKRLRLTIYHSVRARKYTLLMTISVSGMKKKVIPRNISRIPRTHCTHGTETSFVGDSRVNRFVSRIWLDFVSNLISTPQNELWLSHSLVTSHHFVGVPPHTIHENTNQPVLVRHAFWNRPALYWISGSFKRNLNFTYPPRKLN